MGFSSHPADAEAAVGLISGSSPTKWSEKDAAVIGESEVLTNLPRLVPRCLDILKRLLLFLLPSFVAEQLSPSSARPRTPRPTAHLDGLRGLACLAVVHDHLKLLLSKTAGSAYGYPGLGTEWWKLPIIKLVYGGSFAVAIFFVISGYALSVQPVLAMRTVPREADVAMKKLASAVFRRPIRLLLPCWATMFIGFVLVRLGVFEWFAAMEPIFHSHYDGWVVITDQWAFRTDSIFAQIADFTWDGMHLLWLFVDWGEHIGRSHYGGFVTWTIPLEFRASLVLFFTQAALFFVRRQTRLIIVSALVVAGAYIESFDFPLFWIGFLLAEMTPVLRSAETKQTPAHTAAYVAVCVVGLYLGSHPAWGADNTPGYMWMIPLTPWEYEIANNWWTGVGAALTVFSLDRLAGARRLFTSRVVAYLGRISFSVYLMHLMILQTLGSAVFHYSYELTGVDTAVPAFLGFALGYVVIYFIIIWAADIFMRCVDGPCIALGFKAQGWLFEEE